MSVTSCDSRRSGDSSNWQHESQRLCCKAQRWIKGSKMDQIWFWLDYCCGKKHGQRKRRFLGLSWILDKMNRKFQVIKQICGHCNVKCTVVLLVTSFGNEHCNASFGTAFVYRKSDEDFSEHLGKYTCRCNSSLKCWNAGQARSHKLGNMTSKSIALRITFSIFNTAFLIFPLEYPYAALSSSPSTLAAMCMHAAWIIWNNKVGCKLHL